MAPKFVGKFDILAEDSINRYNMGGLLSGDLVKIRKDYKKNDKYQAMMSNYKENIDLMATTDLNLRVSSVKSIRPNTTHNYGGGQGSGTDAPADYYVDISIETAPGLYKNPTTVPIEILELVDTKGNLAPIPDSMKRKSDVHGPKEVESTDKDRKLPTKDTTMANSKGPKDGRDDAKKPAEDKRDQSGKLKKLKKEATDLEGLYGEMINE